MTGVQTCALPIWPGVGEGAGTALQNAAAPHRVQHNHIQCSDQRVREGPEVGESAGPALRDVAAAQRARHNHVQRCDQRMREGPEVGGGPGPGV